MNVDGDFVYIELLLLTQDDAWFPTKFYLYVKQSMFFYSG